jgi:hypothetical protein
VQGAVQTRLNGAGGDAQRLSRLRLGQFQKKAAVDYFLADRAQPPDGLPQRMGAPPRLGSVTRLPFVALRRLALEGPP